jgi:hypothetical protein
MAAVPFCHIYHYEEEGMSFKVTFTLRARKVEKWIRVIQEKLNVLGWTSSTLTRCQM